MKKIISRLRQQLKDIEASRETFVNGILAERGALRPGSVVSIKRKCGKANCHCATGEGHPATCLSTKEKGVTRMIYIPDSVKARVKEEARRYRRFRQNRAHLAKLARASLEIIDALQDALQSPEPIPKRRKRSKISKEPHKGKP